MLEDPPLIVRTQPDFTASRAGFAEAIGDPGGFEGLVIVSPKGCVSLSTHSGSCRHSSLPIGPASRASLYGGGDILVCHWAIMSGSESNGKAVRRAKAAKEPRGQGCNSDLGVL